MKLTDRKGISPLIAAVLLIAFTMAVASLFAQWAPSLIQEAQGETKNTSGELQRCSSVVLDITNVDDSPFDVATVQQVGGDSAAGNVSATFTYSDGTSPKQSFGDITNNRGITTVNSSARDSSVNEVRVVSRGCEGAPAATWP